MNKFLNRRKAPEPAPVVPVDVPSVPYSSSTPQLSPALKKSGTTRWKRNRRQPEPKPEVNLALVLPSEDDFRTSLIMPNLSARFSMLREQDDPNSKLGKASDDSVLQPRRRSRMIDFGAFASNAALGDIAEVASIRSSIRPPFASSRQDSYAASDEGYDSDSGLASSIMSRARPGEGNTLFGGRQKVYMIPKSSASSARAQGKAVYEDDIGTSAFQKHQQREREAAAAAKMADEAKTFDFGLDQHTGAEDDEYYAARARHTEDPADMPHSPSLSSYDKKRSTNSSTARSEARSSTAATSVASQPMTNTPANNVVTPAPVIAQGRPSATLERSNTKGRRLYEAGLDQHIHEQQNSTMTRMNSTKRQRNVSAATKPSPPFLHQVKSTGNLHDPPSQRSVYALRTQSPPPERRLGLMTNLGSLKKSHSASGSPNASGPASPLTPHLDEGDAHVLSQAIEPADRGKATAMGAFNKPKAAFDEKQYLERQLQLQRSASTTLKRDPSASSLHRQPVPRLEQDGRDRSNSAASNRSRSASASKDNIESNRAFQVFQSAAARNQNLNPTPPDQSPQQSPPSIHPTQSNQSAPPVRQVNGYPDPHRTFFGQISSDSDDEEDLRMRFDPSYAHAYGKWQPTVLPSVSEHPALRSQQLVEEEEEEEEEVFEDAQSKPQAPLSANAPLAALETDVNGAASFNFDGDSPTLATRTEDLNMLVSHLRSKSNVSSIYPADDTPPAPTAVPPLPANSHFLSKREAVHPAFQNRPEAESRLDSTYSNSNPWDLEDASNDYATRNGIRSGSISPIENDDITSRTGTQRGQIVSQVSSQDSDPTSWQHELRRQHNRDASTATQQERAAFDNELAARRAAIQDNIKSIVDTSDRCASPVQSSNSSAFKAFGMLRTKSSRDSVDPQRNVSAKALKMLGMSGTNSPSSGSPTVGSQQERGGFSFDIARPRGDSGSRPPPTASNNSSSTRPLHSEQDAPPRRDWSAARARGDNEGRLPGRSPSSEASHRNRSRSNSAATAGRSRSRTGPYRDDLEKAMIEGTGSSAAGHPDISPLLPRELTPRASPDVLQGPFDSTARARSGSRTAPSGYFDAKGLHPAQTPASSRMGMHGPSPPTLSPAVYTPNGPVTRPSPAASPFAPTATPPLSGASTPLNSSFTSMPAINGTRPIRKKTISKSDISEPTLIMSTSTIDTVDLPPGASLKNGMNEAPPVPPVNPKRRGTRKIFGGMGRSESSEDHPSSRSRSNTPDPWATRAPHRDFSAQSSRAPSAEPSGYHVLTPPPRGYDSSPAVNQHGFQQPNGQPHERIDKQTAAGATSDGAMF